MGFFRQLGCAIIGWNPAILAQCGESSRRMFRKLLSAVFIMAMLWGTIGYIFADRYLNIEHWWGCALVSLAFILIIVSVERIIILKVGKSRWIFVFRAILAVCMSLLGGFVFDQVVFQTDISSEIERRREEIEIPNTIRSRQQTIQTDIDYYTAQIDTLSQNNLALYDEINKRPQIKTTLVSTRQVHVGVDSLGREIYEPKREMREETMANPKTSLVKSNTEQIHRYEEKLSDLQTQKQNIDTQVRQEYKNKPVGFMEELDASWDIIMQSPLTVIVYALFMLFILLLELMVVTTRAGEECDYDLIVEHQLEVKKLQLQNAQRTITKEYVQGQMENKPINGVEDTL